MKQFHSNLILPFNITITKHSQIEKLDSSKMIVNHFIHLVINFVLEITHFSISMMMVN